MLFFAAVELSGNVPADVMKDRFIRQSGVYNSRRMRMHAGLDEKDGDALDVSEPVAFHWPVPKDKQVCLALYFESEVPTEVFLCRVTGLNTVPLQFVYNVLRGIISK